MKITTFDNSSRRAYTSKTSNNQSLVDAEPPYGSGGRGTQPDLYEVLGVNRSSRA
jgi:hypothetical protein